MHTPSSYMYSDLRSFGGITNKIKKLQASSLPIELCAATVRPVIELMKELFYQGRSSTQPQARYILSFLATFIKAPKQ